MTCTSEDIEALLLDNDGIESIEAHLGGFNIFEAIGHTRSEERHSDFLAFLLDPNGSHGLGPEFISRFVIEAIKKVMPPEPRPLSLSEVALMDLEGCLVLREFHRVDILCIDETQQFLLAIENKVGTGEHSDQLKRYRSFLETQYPNFRRVLVYLTPDKDAPSDEAYAPVGYGEVLSIVENLAKKHAGSLGNAVAIALNHYARMLRRNIVTDELVNIAKAIYRKHRTALDFIFEQRQDDQLEISECAAELASKDGRVEVVKRVKTYIDFFPNAWTDIPAFNATPADQWTQTGHSLLFEFRNTTNHVKMVIVIGPAEEGLRRKILDFCHQKRDLFPGASKHLSAMYTQIYSKTLVDRATLEKQPIAEVLGTVKNRFQAFMKGEFSSIVDALAKDFRDVRVD